MLGLFGLTIGAVGSILPAFLLIAEYLGVRSVPLSFPLSWTSIVLVKMRLLLELFDFFVLASLLLLALSTPATQIVFHLLSP